MARQTEDRGLSSAALHILAMGCMLCDHLGVFFPGSVWLPCAGRLAFPIFAFLIAEGVRHTRDRRRYMKRLLFLAVLSEIPFDLQYERSAVYLFHQNVIWTFLIALLVIGRAWRCWRWSPSGCTGGVRAVTQKSFGGSAMPFTRRICSCSISRSASCDKDPAHDQVLIETLLYSHSRSGTDFVGLPSAVSIIT